MFRKLRIVFLALFLLAIAIPGLVAQDDTYNLTIMHTNDVHAAHEPSGDGDGGAARQATVVNQIRAEVPNSLLLDGGDRFTGTLFHVQWQGQDSAQIMNMIGYDAMTLGNHEFDNGDAVLAAFINAVDFPVVTANVDFSESPTLAGLVQPYVILEVGGEQIGIIGLVTPESEILSSPGDELVFNYDLIGVTQSMVDELSAQGVTKIILLTHIGFMADQLVAQGVSGVDVVVGGHTNTFLSNRYAGAEGDYPLVLESASGEPVLVVQASTRILYLGRLDVTFDANGVLTNWEGDAILLSRYIPADPDVSDLVAGLAEPIADLRLQPVGEAAVDLDGERTTCRFAECTMGNVITDALREATGADIAVTNGGGIRASIPAGQVTLGNVLEVLPFGNLVSTFEFTGADVWAMFENSVSRVDVDEGTGRFLQVSGARYTFDASQAVGSRIVSVEVWQDGAWVALDLEATYRIATNDFVRTGGDGYDVMAENAINAYDQGSPLDVVLADYIRANSPISAELEGRITEVTPE